MTLYYISLFFAFALMNFLPAMGAYYFAKYLNRGGYSELFLLAFSIFFIEAIISFGIAGVSGHLNYITCGIINSLIGTSLCFFKNHAKPVKSKPFTPAERLFVILIFMSFLLRFYWASMMHSGTDTYLYHFFYPAMWLTEGRLFPVSIAGLPCEYYPVYGELLYGWLMLPFGDVSFSIFLQLLSCIMACGAIIAVAKAFGFRRLDGLIAAGIMISCSIISENSILGYTDVLNGSFLVAGFALMLLGALRNNMKFAVIAGLVLGCSASIKYTGLLLTPVLTFLFLVLFVCFRKKLWKYSIFAACSAFIAAAPGYIVNWVKTGNPLYPVKVHVGAVQIFTAGIDTKHDVSGLNLNTWSLFVNSNVWDMNLATGILYVCLPFASIALFCLHRRFLKKQLLFLFLALIIIILTVIQLCSYPAIAQARQIIPLLMLSAFLLIPLSNVIFSKKKPLTHIICVSALIGLCVLLSYTKNHIDIITMWTLIGISGLFFALLPDKKFRYCCLILILVFAGILPYLFQIRLTSRKKHNYAFAGPAGAKCMEIVWNDYGRNNKPVQIALVGTWLNYMFMADMPGNRVIYVPVNEKNSTHPHMFNSHSEIRDNPVPFVEWYKRLRKQNIKYLVIGLEDYDLITNKEQELRWTKAHPEYFEKLIDNGSLFMFRLKK